MHFTLINVYIHIRYVEKVGCWDSLKSIRECLPLNSCIIVRYFNTILSSSEKRGDNDVPEPVWEKLEYLISNWDPIDVKSSKGNYT